MRRVRLGRTDMEVSAIGAGAWQAGMRWGGDYTREEAKAALIRYFELGVNFVDTAEIYGGGTSEGLVGEAVREFEASSGREVFVATKLATFNLDRAEASLRASLERLGRGYVDLYQLHWPPPRGMIGEAMRALERLVDKGLARYVGVSNFSGEQLRLAAESLSRHELASDQVRYNLLHREAELDVFPAARELGAGVIAWGPLGQGALTGKYWGGRARPSARAFRGDHLKAVESLPALREAISRVAASRGATPAQVALAWVVAKGAVPIPGAKRREQAEENALAGELELSPDDVRWLDSASPPPSSGYSAVPGWASWLSARAGFLIRPLAGLFA